MKTQFRILSVLLTVGVALLLARAQENPDTTQAIGDKATAKWALNDPAELVQLYVVEYRGTTTAPWTRVTVPGTSNSVAVPFPPYDMWFRIAASNTLGLGPWTAESRVPRAVRNFVIVTETVTMLSDTTTPAP